MVGTGSGRPVMTALVLLAVLVSSVALARVGGGAAYGGSGSWRTHSSYGGRGPWSDISENLQGLVAVIMLFYGILQCYFGYRLFKIVLGVIGFLFGAFLGMVIAALGGAEQGVVILVSLLCGVLGAYLAITLYFVGVFLIGAGAGAVLIQILAGGDAGTAGVVAAAIVVGIVALLVQKAVIIVATSLSGAYALAGFISLVAERISTGAYIGLFLLFLISGILVQFLVTARNAPKDVKKLMEGSKSAPAAAEPEAAP